MVHKMPNARPLEECALNPNRSMPVVHFRDVAERGTDKEQPRSA